MVWCTSCVADVVGHGVLSVLVESESVESEDIEIFKSKKCSTVSSRPSALSTHALTGYTTGSLSGSAPYGGGRYVTSHVGI